METFVLKEDINVMCVTASSFPAGIGEAFAKIEKLLPAGERRKLYGISRPDKEGTIVYKAAAEESYPGEAEKLGAEAFVIPQGEYVSKFLPSWRKDESVIHKTFMDLIAEPGLDPNGFCLEVYEGKEDVRCMVRLDSARK